MLAYISNYFFGNISDPDCIEGCMGPCVNTGAPVAACEDECRCKKRRAFTQEGWYKSQLNPKTMQKRLC